MTFPISVAENYIGALSSTCQFPLAHFSDWVKTSFDVCLLCFSFARFVFRCDHTGDELRRRMLRLDCLLFIVWGRRSYVCAWSPTLFFICSCTYVGVPPCSPPVVFVALVPKKIIGWIISYELGDPNMYMQLFFG